MCDVDLWINGVVLLSIGSGLFTVSFIIKTAMKNVQAEQKYSDRIEMKAKLIDSELPETDIESHSADTMRRRSLKIDF